MIVVAVVHDSSDAVVILIVEKLLISKPLACSIISAKDHLLLTMRDFMLFNKLPLPDDVH